MSPFGGVDFSSFLNQPVDQVILQLIWLFGWVPIVIVIVMGIMQTWVEIQRRYWRTRRPYILLAIDVPRLTEQSPKAVENIFGVVVALKSSPTWLETYIQGKNQWRHSFEITSINGYIQFYIWTEERYRDALEASVYSQYPDAEIALVKDYTKTVPHHYPNDEYDMWGSEYVLKRENFYPIRTWMDYEHSASRDDYLKDPLTNLFETFSLMKPGEQIWFQVITEYADPKWKAEGDAFITKTFGADAKDKHSAGPVTSALQFIASIPGTIAGDIVGTTEETHEKKENYEDLWKAFKVTEQQREITKAVVRKIAKPGLACKIRVIYIARKEIFSKVTRKDMIKGTLKQLAHEDMNQFTGHGSPEDDYFWQIWWYSYYQNELIEGYVHRSTTMGAHKFVLNTEELATIWHFPTVNVKAPLIKKTLAKRAEPPTGTPFASEEEEMLTAPSMVLPPGQEEEEKAPTADIFTSPMSMPPSELPEEIMEEEEESEHAPEPMWAQPVVASPTKGIGGVPAPRTEASIGGANTPRHEIVAPSEKPTDGIPDAIRVLIQPGVEPEDVGVDATIKDDL